MGGLEVICLAAYFVGFTPDSVSAWDDRSRYGKLIGKFNTKTVNGTVYARNEVSLLVKSFFFNGDDQNDTFLRDQSGDEIVGMLNGKKITSLSTLRDVDIILHFPSLKNVDFLAVARNNNSDENDTIAKVMIPIAFRAPEKLDVGPFTPKAGDKLRHGLSSGNIIILDAKTFFIPKLNYEGDAPLAFFWVGKGPTPHEKGIKVPDEYQSYDRLRTKYKSKNITIELPGNLTVYDIEWLSMWCVKYKQNFGYVSIPSNLNVPPALGFNYPDMYNSAIPHIASFLTSILIVIPVVFLR